MDLQLEEVEEPTLEQAAKLIAAKESELLSREVAILKEREALERAKKNLEAMRASLGSLLSELDRPAVSIGTEIMKLANDFGAAVAEYGEIKKAMRATISRFTQRAFSTRELIHYLHLWYPHIKIWSNRSNISSYLRDFVSEGLIEIQQEGSGQRPAVYRKK